MKTRNGFVSNSSSSSFVISIPKWMLEAEWDKNKTKTLYKNIMKMTERSDDLTRCTGRICDIKQWLNLLNDGGEEDCYTFQKIVKLLYKDDNNIIVVRESDEQMGGSLSDYGITEEDLYPFLIYKFEYH